MSIDPDGTRIITAGGKVTRFWGLPGLEPQPPLDNGIEFRAAAFGVAGRLFAIAGTDRRVRLYDRAGRAKPVHTLDHRETGGDDHSWLPRMAFSADDTFLATGGVNTKLLVWNTATGRRVDAAPDLLYVWALAFGPFDRILAVGMHDSTVHLIDVRSGQEFEPMNHPRDYQTGVKQLCFSPDGGRLVSLATNGSLCAWDVETAAEERHLWCDNVTCVAFGRSPAILAGADKGGAVHVWDTATGDDVFRDDEAGDVRQLALSPDGGMLAMVGADMRARVCDIRSGDVSVVDDNFLVHRLAFSPDGRLLATAGHRRQADRLYAKDNDAIRLWTGITS
jgi:WD40 repeat protein